ncbi:hypothetical protein DNU06_02695 [Putridiphycobacter roseus]|uniref:Mechanosensitive ion channel protein MscS n=1 Tax=Putridiphycobacter roseus TaxID=2219161 RepID=A0A2W1N4L0_9FLAO|nr:mechanosensitive ion channel domain-containing protein [Putridiphycobacter roseus]PZE18754.1 hypothetical protein DNU06_02695 [Putridiphycobacter roseus]
MNPIKDILEFSLIHYKSLNITVGSIVLTVIIYLMAKLVLFLVKRIMVRVLEKTEHEKGRSVALFQIFRYFIWFAFFAIILRVIGIELTFLVASSAALMVGVGLGLQNVFNDFVSGIIILFEGSVIKGDIITVDDMIGEVKIIKIRTSEILTRNNITIIVPNHKLVIDNIINWSHLNKSPRFVLKLGVAYGSPTKKVKEILLEQVSRNAEIDKQPKPFVRFNDFGDSSLDFEVFFWSENIFRIDDVLSDLRFEIDDAFRAEGITIPFPQRDLHIVSGVDKLNS